MKAFGAVVRAAHAAGVVYETVQVKHEHHPYQAIINTAESRDCDLIVMASHGRHGISAIILGSETVKVTQQDIGYVLTAAGLSGLLSQLPDAAVG